ncbi:MAG: type II secretion system protein F, partial [Demequina sp.]|nr:type II secretion system protein F [Demequina sp.]
MTAVIGLALGAGLFLVWWSFWPPQQAAPRRPDGWYARTQDRLIQAGAPAVTPWALVSTAVGLGLAIAVLASAGSGSPVIGLAFGVIAARGPFALVQARAGRRQASMREVWPNAVDNLASGIRAGLSLPEALGQLGERGPESLREPFTAF